MKNTLPTLPALHFHPLGRRLPRLFVVLLLAAATGAFSQTTALLDSLLAVLPKAAEDTNKVHLLGEISYEYASINTDEGIKHGLQALALSEKQQWEKGIAIAKRNIGRNHWRKGNFEDALKFHFESLALWQKLGDKKQTYPLWAMIGQDYADAGNYPEALKYLSLALKGYEELGYKGNQGYAHSILSWVYGKMGMHPEALTHQYAALKIAEELGDRYGMSIALSNLSASLEEQGKYEEALKTYKQCLEIDMEFEDFINAVMTSNSIGRCHKFLGDYTEALSQHSQALELGKKLKDGNSKGESYSYIGDVHQAQGNNAEALTYFRLAAKEFDAVDNKHLLAQLYTKIGDCLTKLGSYAEARKYFDDAFSLTKELESVGEFNNFYGSVVRLDSATGNWRNAFDHYKLFVSTRDSMYNEENTKKVVQTQMQYEFDKKEAAARAEQEKKDAEARATLQRQKLIRNGFMGGFVVVVLFAGVFFNQRNKIKVGKKQSDELLLNILPAEVAEELKAKGYAEAKLMDEVTVLFSDFKGFTSLSETLTPKELVAEINECFSAFDHIMQRHGVEKIKTVGDAYMAAGGLPTPSATHAADVLNAALEMQAFMRERQQKREAEGRFFFEARIGVNTGPVVAGIVGVKKFAYDIWGDTVNTAQRMESNSEAGRVNISGSTYELVKSQFDCTYRGKIDTKGKGEVDMYFVVPNPEA
ncbi:MAG: tetratricopeptide repeat protein [Bacteroidetes bacterium]|nr:tetratricopeptide repeat protein [Bacteroidota bacterium]